ncbi:Os02g0744666 [Oryza sativa Japonica Group]|uniref:Os02g0744666 protein n=1 Tax=Oryza sativa subsp. japonica TaxID=39947 RepID=A0A0N7KG32_ORYSJ|nr:hypothetical protein EE612_013649 [Oryza sativa]BAS80889.1 Os02g0744666 [Oryza sativa Japonica Group]
MIAVGMRISSHKGICTSGKKTFIGSSTLKKKKVKNVDMILRAMKKSYVMYNFFQNETFCSNTVSMHQFPGCCAT